VAGHVDIRTGVSVGTARAYVAGLRTGGEFLDLISSCVQVRHEPGRRPTVTYRISVAGDPVAAGTDVPADEPPGRVGQVPSPPGWPSCPPASCPSRTGRTWRRRSSACRSAGTTSGSPW
jgi:hypothetical protein